jgi:hypothetical protein
MSILQGSLFGNFCIAQCGTDEAPVLGNTTADLPLLIKNFRSHSSGKPIKTQTRLPKYEIKLNIVVVTYNYDALKVIYSHSLALLLTRPPAL